MEERMTTYLQDKDFRDEIIGTDLLEESIAWISSNLDPEEVFDESKLQQWAKDNGFVADMRYLASHG
jgi:hypothetical protein